MDAKRTHENELDDSASIKQPREDGDSSVSTVRRSKRRQTAQMESMCKAIIKASNEVLEMGYGYSEAVYEKALMVEIQLTNIGIVLQQVPITYTYKDHPVGAGRLDILVTHPHLGDSQIVVELKLEGIGAVKTINDAIDQVRGYLRSMPPESRGIVVVFPKPGKHHCMCVVVAGGTSPPYVSSSTLSSTYSF